MEYQANWEKALKYTEIIRPRINPLSKAGTTQLPYIFLSESLQDSSSTFVRKGHIGVDQPTLLLPPNNPQFDGFEMNEYQKNEMNTFMNFLLVRGVRFPSLNYHHSSFDIAVHDGKLQEAINFHKDVLQREENMTAGLVVGKEDCWQFSILVFVASQMIKSSEGDVDYLMKKLKREDPS